MENTIDFKTYSKEYIQDKLDKGGKITQEDLDALDKINKKSFELYYRRY